jgi:hypothetical protein
MSHYDWADLIDSIKSTAKMQKIGPKMGIFGLISTKFRSKQLKIWPRSHFWSTWLDSIVNSKFNEYLIVAFDNCNFSEF